MAKCCKIKQDNYEMYHLRIFSQQVGLNYSAVPQQTHRQASDTEISRGQEHDRASRCLRRKLHLWLQAQGAFGWLWIQLSCWNTLIRKPEGRQLSSTRCGNQA